MDAGMGVVWMSECGFFMILHVYFKRLAPDAERFDGLYFPQSPGADGPERLQSPAIVS